MRIIKSINTKLAFLIGLRMPGFIVLTFSLSLLFSTCELNNLNLSCDDCWEAKPSEGLLMIDLSPLRNGDSIPVTVYKGKLESGAVFLQDTVVKDYLDIWVPIDNFYTVVAEYKVDNTIIKAVDGDNVSVYLDETNCSVACWRARDGKADCELR